MARLVVVHGYAGAGKSTQCSEMVRDGFQGSAVHHVSAGNRLRAIRTGMESSRFADIINASNAPSPLPDDIVAAAMFETFRNVQQDELALIDGYPRHPQAVDTFRDIVAESGHRLLGTVALTITLEASIQRVLTRGRRAGELVVGESLEDFARHRYEQDTQTTNIAIAALSRIAPVEYVDAGQNIEAVYAQFCSAIGALAATDITRHPQ